MYYIARARRARARERRSFYTKLDVSSRRQSFEITFNSALAIARRRLAYLWTTCAGGACTTITCGCGAPACGFAAAAACRSLISRLTWHCKHGKQQMHEITSIGAVTPTRSSALLNTLDPCTHPPIPGQTAFAISLMRHVPKQSPVPVRCAIVPMWHGPQQHAYMQSPTSSVQPQSVLFM